MNKNTITNDEVILENEKLHDFGAKSYDNYPLHHKRQMSKMFLRSAKRCIGNNEPSTVRVLDCGAGIGNLGIEFYKLGCDVTLVDVSNNMLSVADEKFKKQQGGTFRTINSPIEDFLKKGNKYDVICFSSVLHHLYNYMEVINLASKILTTNGKLLIIDGDSNDVKLVGLKHVLHSIFESLFLAYRVLKRPVYAIRWTFANHNKKINVDIAEFTSGVDMISIVRYLHDNFEQVSMDCKKIYYWRTMEFIMDGITPDNRRGTYYIVAIKRADRRC